MTTMTTMTTTNTSMATLSDKVLSLSQPRSPVSSIWSTEQLQQTILPYIPRTLQQDSRRYWILPAFPTTFINNQPSLLPSNVPGMS
jgi:hypothetical protein